MKQEEKPLPLTANLTFTNEYERLKKNVYMPDMEKLRLFTQMLRTNKKLKQAVIHHQ